jgi:hypothetical protein
LPKRKAGRLKATLDAQLALFTCGGKLAGLVRGHVQVPRRSDDGIQLYRRSN